MPKTVIFILSCLLILLPGTYSIGKESRVLWPIEINKKNLEENSIKEIENPLAVFLNANQGGLKVSVRYSGQKISENGSKSKTETIAQEIPPGGELVISFDQNTVQRKNIYESEIKFDHVINPNLLSIGEHTLLCELFLFSGEKLTNEISFQFDGSPLIEIDTTTSDVKVFDPLLTIYFMGEGEKTSGYLEVHIDERPVGLVQITKDINGMKKGLSELLKKKLDIYNLAQGTHLLRLSAKGINGLETVKYVSFEVNAKPSLEIKHDKQSRLKEIIAYFPATETGFNAALEIYYRQGVILSKSDKNNEISVTRQEIEESFKKHKHTIKSASVSLVVATHTANGAELWQQIEYK